MKVIKLTQGKEAIVDDEDYCWINKFKWYVSKTHTKDKWYAKGQICGLNVQMHRLLLNAPKNMQVDHINGDGLDNRKANIRLCTRSENQHNATKSRTAMSRFKGVSKANGKWTAQISLKGKSIHLGTFSTEIDAAKEYNSAAILYHGKFAKLNDITESKPKECTGCEWHEPKEDCKCPCHKEGYSSLELGRDDCHCFCTVERSKEEK